MHYGEIARKIREETRRLNTLADELDRIEEATPKIDKTLEVPQTKMLISVNEAAKASCFLIILPQISTLVHGYRIRQLTSCALQYFAGIRKQPLSFQ